MINPDRNDGVIKSVNTCNKNKIQCRKISVFYFSFSVFKTNFYKPQKNSVILLSLISLARATTMVLMLDKTYPYLTLCDISHLDLQAVFNLLISQSKGDILGCPTEDM